MHARTRKFVLLGAALVSMITGFLLARALYDPPPVRPDVQALLWPEPKSLGAFTLTDQRGQPFDLDRLSGKWSFLFFGYTFCPDVCPTTLAELAEVAKLLGSEQARDAQFVFVSVDPQRDTHERIGNYVEFFDKGFVGATGTREQIDTLTRQLGILYVLNPPDAEGNYLVDHSAAILLVDPSKRLVGVFQAPHAPADVAGQFAQIKAFLDAQS